ncbi:MAG: DNA mismatch repair protein MutS [Betaproteobacteria bacterium]|nr:DNA mismatch repair protein MutS [Betaproteobacteria bacterium]
MADADFAKAIADVRPLKPARRTTPATPPPPPLPVQMLRDERAALVESIERPITPEEALETGEELVYLRDGLSRLVLRRLRRGHWVVQMSLDLHGMNRHEAAAQVAEFLLGSAQRGLRCVRIVHGKGYGSKNREPVLKGKLRNWLAMRDEVLAYCQAPAHEGGSGALLVLLKTRR